MWDWVGLALIHLSQSMGLRWTVYSAALCQIYDSIFRTHIPSNICQLTTANEGTTRGPSDVPGQI